MSDFLDSLVAHAAAAEPTIQPRTLSRFEPASRDSFAHAQLSVDEMLDTESISQPAGLSTADDARSPLTVAQPWTQLGDGAADPDLARRMESIAQQLAALRAAHSMAGQQPRDDIAAGWLSSGESGPQPRTTKAAHDEPLAERPPADAPLSPVSHAIFPRRGQELAGEDRPAHGGPPQPDHRAAVVEDYLPSARPDTPRIIPEQLPHTSPVAKVQTSVNVTIGRVEIKAVRTNGPAAATRTESNRSRVMSLEAYLQRRTAGGVG